MNTARGVIKALNLVEHREGGYFAETFRNEEQMASDREGGSRSLLTSIYYMLSRDRPIGYFHRNHSTIVHYFHDGSPLTYLLIDEHGELTRHRLGNDVASGCLPQLIVSGGIWKATVLEEGEYGLLGEAVAPGFEYHDMEFGRAGQMKSEFPQLWSEIAGYVR